MEEEVAVDATEGQDHVYRRIAKRLEGRTLDNDALADCGPLLQRIVRAVEEAEESVYLDDVFDRAYKLIADSFSQLSIDSDVEKQVSDITLNAGRLIVTKALFSRGRTSPSTSSSMSVFEQNVWCRIGQLSLRLVCEAASGFFLAHSGMDSRSKRMRGGGVGSPQQASAFLLDQIPWMCSGDGKDFGDTDPPMVSAFTVVWSCVLSLLLLLYTPMEMMVGGKDEEEQGSDVVSRDMVYSQMEKGHPLPLIVSDCTQLMVERNYHLLCEAQGTNGVGVAAEVFSVAANNFAWLQHHCSRLHMSEPMKVRSLIAQCTACVLQDVVNGYISDMQQSLFSYIDSSIRVEQQDQGEKQTTTCSTFATRLSAARSFLNHLAPSLPRREVVSMILEGLLRPVVENLFDRVEELRVLKRGDSSKTAWRLGKVLLPAGVFLFQDAAAKHADGMYDGGDTSPSTTTTGTSPVAMQRLSEVLQLMENDSAFGALMCQRSASFRTLQRLLPTLVP